MSLVKHNSLQIGCVNIRSQNASPTTLQECFRGNENQGNCTRLHSSFHLWTVLCFVDEFTRDISSFQVVYLIDHQTYQGTYNNHNAPLHFAYQIKKTRQKRKTESFPTASGNRHKDVISNDTLYRIPLKFFKSNIVFHFNSSQRLLGVHLWSVICVYILNWVPNGQQLAEGTYCACATQKAEFWNKDFQYLKTDPPRRRLTLESWNRVRVCRRQRKQHD